jgi:gliding motility-associated-like protein
MRSLALIFSTLFLLNIVGFSQQTEPVETPQDWPSIMKKYGSFETAVYEMTREEWAIYRATEDYDQRQVAEIIEAHREISYPEEMRHERKQTRMSQAGECDCWIEPDDTYIEVTEFDWDDCQGGGVGVDCWMGPIGFNGWSFDLYGTTYDAFYITSKGTISFDTGFIDWTPDEFPGATWNQIAGYWADSDFTEIGELHYKLTPEALYVNVIDVGYYSGHSDKTNSFQMILTPDGGLLGDEKNVQLCFQNMDWAHGDVGGGNGFNGPSPGNVGADRASTLGPNIQFGRFNLNSSVYNGPYGFNNQNQDGIHWLDYKVFEFNTASTSINIPPIPTISFGCDTIQVCLNDTLSLDMEFLAPETQQLVNITIEAEGEGLVVNSITPGSPASIDIDFIGSMDNLGIQAITITATDVGDPVGITTVVIYVNVVPIELPVLTIEGNLNICAGQLTTLSASAGFEEYIWSNGCVFQDCDVTSGGIYNLIATLSGCEADASVFVDQTPLFLPDVFITPNPVCGSDSALVYVDPDEVDDYVTFSWESNYNGLGGEVYSEGLVDGINDSIYAAPGTYRLFVTNEEGCGGQRVFNIFGEDPFIPADIWSGAYCDGLSNTEIVFNGAYNNPATGNLNLYLSTSDNGGWNGAYITVIVDGEQFIFTTTSTFEIYFVPIQFGDLITINYTPSGDGDENNLLQLFNCSNQNNQTISDLTGGNPIYEAPAGCAFQPAYGDWEVVSGPGGDFTVESQFNTTYTPGAYGMHVLEFTDSSCFEPYIYNIEVTLPPGISIDSEDVVLCDGEPFTFNVDIDDIGGTATIDWPAPGTDDVLSNTYSYNQPEDLDLTVTIENGCGSDDADFHISSQYAPEPELQDEFLCEDGSVTLDPIDNDTEDLIYEWTVDGVSMGETGESIVVSTTGEYCVNVSNECHPDGVVACASISIAAVDVVLPEFIAPCNGTGEAVLNPAIPEGWTWVWSDGNTDEIITVDDNGVFCGTISDPNGCLEEEHCITVFIGDAPTATPTPVEPLVLCPEVPETFTLNSGASLEYNWSLSCGDVIFSALDALTITSNQIPQDCWQLEIQIIGEGQNPCGSVSASFDVLVDACNITIPNVITPQNGDNVNDGFFVEGLEVYNNVFLNIFNRWGMLVYEDDDYESGRWKATDSEDGTYYYVLILPNGREHTGHVTVLR